MKTITKYMANDKTEFADSLQCLKYETDCKIIDTIFAQLRKDERLQANGGENYIQHKIETVAKVRREFWLAATELYPFLLKFNPNMYSRVLDDATEPAARYLRMGDYRLGCIDSLGMEWGQMYFANNPNPYAVQL